MRALSPNNASGFFGYVQRLMAYSSRPTELEGVLKALARAREQVIALGAGAVCIAVVAA
jgi:hypothetical protein